MKKKANLFSTLIILLSTVFLCGCSALTYTGADYKKENIRALATDEALYFSAYQKNLQEGIDVSAGITKSQLPSILVLYLGIDNKTNKEYSLSLQDVQILANSKPANIINTSDFISAYISATNESYSGAQAIAATVNTFATVANNYQGNNQNQAIKNQNNAEASANHLATFTNGVRSHMLNATSLVKAGESKYYYVFIQESDYPIVINYKTLQYTFDSKK